MRSPLPRRGWTTVRLFSGLGNQLFQYARGRAVAEATRTKLRFDVSYFGLEPHREYALGDFHIHAMLANHGPLPAEQMSDHEAEARYAADRFAARVVRERRSELEVPRPARPEPNSFLCGYWQNERYFSEAARKIRRELVPQKSSAISAGSRQIASAPVSIGLHVRRGDLVSDPAMTELFGVTGIEYYQRAAGHLLAKHVDAELFIFSDDPAWCRDQFDLPAPTHVMSGENAAFEDLILMSRCDHAVITASTFSWWAAWLGEEDGGEVVAPREAFTGTKTEPPGFFPARWTRI